MDPPAVGRHGTTVDLEPGYRVKTSFRECQNARVSRTGTLRALLIATAVAGVSLAHLVVGEAAGSLPGLIVGIAVGLGCLRLGLLTRSSGARVLSAFAIAAVALVPLIAYLAQEAAERESGIEAAHVEPSLLAAILAQGTPVALPTKGTVREARGLNSMR